MAGMDNAAFQRMLSIIKGEDVFEIPLQNGGVALVDRDDEHLVSPYNWFSSSGYARASLSGGGYVIMHRLLMGSDGDVVDHIDGNRLNNQRYNLRVCSHAENMRNRHSTSGASRFKGVWRDRSAWRAQIHLNGHVVKLGSFLSERRAARAYDAAALKHYGEFARTNADLGLY